MSDNQQSTRVVVIEPEELGRVKASLTKERVKRIYRGLLAEGFADICARHLDEQRQCLQYYETLPPKDARIDKRIPRFSDCFYQKSNVNLCYAYYRKQMVQSCQTETKQLLQILQLREETRRRELNQHFGNPISPSDRTIADVSPDDVKKTYAKLFYCIRKPTLGLIGKELKYPLDYGFGNETPQQQ